MTPMATYNTPAEAARWLRTRVTGCLQADSRLVRPGDGFIAWPGARTDARQFVGAALAQGAAACVVEQQGSEPFAFGPQDAVISYTGLKAASGVIADAYYGSPSQQLAVVAITGTNGKTSCAWWAAAALSRLVSPELAPCALVGTLGVGVPPNLEVTGLTTPDPVLLQRSLRQFVDAGIKTCALEASSIGLAEQRLAGTAIRVAAFTNFTRDHLDYHGSLDAYWQAKLALFDWPGLQAAVINVDDEQGIQLADHARARRLDVWTISLAGEARLSATDLEQGERGLRWTLHEGDRSVLVDTTAVGAYNAANLMTVIGVLRSLGVPLDAAVAACVDLPAVPGRMERIDVKGGPLAVVDYAHTPDALDKVLTALRPLAARRGGQLWCVFGCGGNRDRGKRPRMAAAAERGADHVLLTSDNPRDEDPQVIMDDMRAGLARPGSALLESDRAQAIKQAVALAAPADVVLIAGKGHENHQDIGGQQLPFSDQAQARAALDARQNGRERVA